MAALSVTVEFGGGRGKAHLSMVAEGRSSTEVPCLLSFICFKWAHFARKQHSSVNIFRTIFGTLLVVYFVFFQKLDGHYRRLPFSNAASSTQNGINSASHRGKSAGHYRARYAGFARSHSSWRFLCQGDFYRVSVVARDGRGSRGVSSKWISQ